MKYENVQHAYNAAAAEYAERFFEEMEHKPFDRKMLDLFAERVLPGKAAYELGCGPGEVACYLKERSVDIHGLDFCDNMIREARRLNPEIPFEQGDVFDLDFPENSLGGIAAFYLIVNFRHEDIPRAFEEIRRVLLPGAPLLLSFHMGSDTIHLEEFLGQATPIDFNFFARDDIATMLQEAGFELDEVLTRSPYNAFEYPSQRAYIFAHK